MDYHRFLDPVSLDKPDYVIDSGLLFSRNLVINTETSPITNINGIQLAIIGIPEDRNSYNTGASLAPDSIRKELYQLFKNNNKLQIADLGNIKAGNTYTDTYAALKWVLNELIENHTRVILIGGTQDLTVPVYESIEKYRKQVNLTLIDARIDADFNNPALGRSNSFLNNIVFKGKQSLSEFNLLGIQEYYTDKNMLAALKDMYFETERLGNIRQNFNTIEPLLRDTHFLSIDVSAIRQNDCNAHFKPSPNGFYGEEICRIAKMAGLSDAIDYFGIFELNARFDVNYQSAALCAQIIWYYIEGLGQRVKEQPGDDSNFKKFVVQSDELSHDLVFYKSLKTQRWWFGINKISTDENVYIACTVDDYNQACNQEIPQRWLNARQRIN